MTEIVKAVSNKRKPARKKPKITENETNNETVVCSEYVKMVQEKKKRNKEKLQDLGLVPKTPTPIRNSQDKNKNSPKEVKNNKTARRKLMQSPRQSPKTKSNKSGKNMKVACPFDHKLYGTNYCEEDDKRYLEEDSELHDVKCQGCKKCFSLDGGKNSIVPTFKQPLYVCRGRQKHQCTFSFCYSCFPGQYIWQETATWSKVVTILLN